MQDHLKERLTGAALLVIVVVLLVPEMFRGRPTDHVDRSSHSVDGPPLRSYDIDLRETPNSQAPAASAPLTNVAPAVAAPPSASPPATPPRVAPSTAAPSTTAPSTVAPSTVAEPAPVPVPAPLPATSQAPVARPAAAAPAPARHPAARPVWIVQVGSFSRRELAERMVRQVRGKGFAVEAAGPDDRGLYRVRSAPVASRAAAMALRQKMQGKGLKPIVSVTP